MTNPITVLIVDDEPLVRDAFRAFLSRQQGFAVVGEAGTADRAAESYCRARPDVVLMDLHLPGSGVTAIRRIRESDPQACILVMTVSSSRSDILGALGAGAAGYLVKNCGGARLLQGISEAAANRMPLAAPARVALAETLTAEPGAAGVLTAREAELLAHLAEGLTNTEIAGRMFVSESSVKQYLLRIGEKVGARNRTQILVRAMRLGLVRPPVVASGPGA